MKKFTILVAHDLARGIGKNNTIPWYLSADLKAFKKITTNGVVIMGRKTWESLPKRPLPNRDNVIITRTLKKDDVKDATITTSLSESLELYGKTDKNIFVIGGAQLYKEALEHKSCSRIITTRISDTYDCDVFFPIISNKLFFKKETTFFEDYFVVEYKRRTKERRHDELQYIEELKKIMVSGRWKMDRTKVGTISCFGSVKMNFDLSNYTLPLITTKFVPSPSIFEELITVFLKGKSHVRDLSEKKIKIWDGNTSREYLDSIGSKDYNVGEAGPFYGYQWRNFGKPYIPEKFREEYEKIKIRNLERELGEQKIKDIKKECVKKIAEKYNIDKFEADISKELRPELDVLYNEELKKYEKKEYYADQVEDCLKLIKESPESRRIIISAWNPNQLKEMCLAPCHLLYQFDVDVETKELSCLLYQRSGDMGLGVPFNIASAATLTHIFAEICGLTAKELIHEIGDAHIYKHHVKELLKQISNKPMPFPKIKFITSLKDMKIDDVQSNMIKVEDYQHHKKIKMTMAV